MNLIGMILGGVVAVVVLALLVTAVLWVGVDARRRGLQRVWLLQLLCAVQFPWPFLMYYFLTRAMDRNRYGFSAA